GTGLVASLAHPGGNVTGLTEGGPELYGKRLELLKDALPTVSRVAILWNPTNTSLTLALQEMKIAAGTLRVTLQPLEVRSPNDFESAFSDIKRERANALIVLRSVILDPGDPVGTGPVASLARPGGNITGVSSIAPD